MTKEEILAMKPGEELDVLIAKGPMGFEVPSYLGISRPTVMISPGVWLPLARYSTNISSAWPLVEKFRIAVIPIWLDGWKWACCDEYALEPGDYKMQWLGELTICDTAPEAICKAALLAKHSTENA